jgi:2-polyprenyl-3-methyl-5-hydroxy-6-metoxy-1,4-benzoquinol methylase
VLNDSSAAIVVILATLGDRLGLFKDLASHGPATSREVSTRTGLQERYVREWLAAMASAGYLRYQPEGERFDLPPEHAPALVCENGPLFLAGLLEMVPPLLGSLDLLTEAFRGGGGISHWVYGGDFWEGMERFSAAWFENVLIPKWIPAMPDVEKKLRAGAAVADVGCGRGRAVIRLAQSFPACRCVGYDAFGPAVGLARKSAWIAGVADRVQFEWRDASDGLPGNYDVITTFDSLHDAPRPETVLGRIRESLNPGGLYVCLETRSSERLEENAGPLGAMLYGWSTLHSLPSSLAAGGEAFGTMGLPEPVLRELCAATGFSDVRRVALDDTLHALYEVRG